MDLQMISKNRILKFILDLILIATLPWIAYHFNLFLPDEVKIKNFTIKINPKYKNNISISAGEKSSLPLSINYPYLCFVSSFLNHHIDSSKGKFFLLTLNNGKDNIFVTIDFSHKKKIIMPTKIIDCEEGVTIDTNRLIDIKSSKMLFKFKDDNGYQKQYKCEKSNILIRIRAVSKMPTLSFLTSSPIGA